jgi:hypothetical protein
LFAGIIEGDVEFIAYLSVGIIGKANTTGFGDGLETSGNVDYVAKYVAGIFDDVADIDSDPELNALIRPYGHIAIGHATLNVAPTSHGSHNAGGLGDEAIAGFFDNVPTMRRNIRGKQDAQMFLQP